MGLVFKARHRVLDRVVALKILPPSFARKRELVSRFRRESQAAARLSHPNIVAVSDADEDRGVYFLAMEFIDGRDLHRMVRESGPLPLDLALECTIQRLLAHQDQTPPSIRAVRPDLPESLDSAYLAMMAKRPEDRPQTMADVIAALDACRRATLSAPGSDSYSRTVAQGKPPNRTQAAPPLPIETGRSRWLELEMPTCSKRPPSQSEEQIQSADAKDLSDAGGAHEPLTAQLWQRLGRLAVVCTLIVVLCLGATRRPIGKLGLPNSPLRSHAIAVFPDGRHALTGGPNGLVHVWDLITRRQVRALERP